MSAQVARVVFAATPLTFDREGALAYTGFGERLFAQFERSGAIKPKTTGRRGERRYYRPQLDALAARVFGDGVDDIDGEFDGLGDD